MRDLVASTPNAEGKWFAAAKHAALFDMAIELAARSPTDPRTLARAARDYADERANFAIESGLAALRWIALGHGYDVTGGDVLGAYLAVMKAASAAGVANERVKVRIREVVSGDQPGSRFVRDVLGRHLVG